jgi:hypothetical protein
MKKKNGFKDDDQKVFCFIENQNCYSFERLTAFLKFHNLPLKPSWYFYCAGKMKLFDDKGISNIPKLKKKYNGHFISEIYYWDRYVQSKRSRVEKIKEKAANESKSIRWFDQKFIDIYENESSIEFIEEAWNSVLSELEWEKKEEQYNDYMDSLAEISFDDYDNDRFFCDACQSSPCMCSDPEKTSTIRP